MSEAPTPFLIAADVVALTGGADGDYRVLVVERGHEPYLGQWALPGGFIEPGEVAEQAARRELFEETGITDFAGRFELLGVYGPSGRRDPRGEIVSVTYLACVNEALPVSGGDDAAAALWVPVGQALEPRRLAFDHARIIADALARLGSEDASAWHPHRE